MRRPYSGNYPVTRPYGVYDPAYSNYPGSKHPGTDYGLQADIPLLAAISGTVTAYRRGTATTGRGNEVVISNGSIQVKTCHMNFIDVVTGQQVIEGQKIGLSGFTGYVLPPGAGGAHLHFEILVNGSYVDPEYYLTQGGSEMITEEILTIMMGAFFGASPTEADRKNWVGKNELSNMVIQFERDKRRTDYFNTVQAGFKCLNNPPTPGFKEYPGTLFIKEDV